LPLPGGANRKKDRKKSACLGDYVLIVEEVTNPPFLGKLLPTAFVVVKVTAPIRKTAKKPTGKKN